MLTDNEVSKLIDPICTIYQQIEYDLIVDIANRLATYDKADGVLEYRLKKLQEFQKIIPELLKIFAKYSGKSEAEIKKLITEAQGLNIDLEPLTTAYDRDIIAVDPVIAMQSPILREIAELSYKDLSKTFSLIQTKAVESAKQAYINTLNTAYVEVASGNYSLQESLKKGLQRMARRGIAGATYKRKNADGSYTYIEYSIEGVIRRDTVTAVHQLANKSSLQLVKEIGADYVEISSHLGARTHPTNPIANHAGWQGGIFKIEGHDDKHRNLKEATGYPDDILGLGGVNCRHRMFAFIPGISKPNPIKYGDTEENKRIYKATQEQRLKERQIRKLKKEIAAIKPLGDKDATKALQIKLKNRQAELQAHCDKYGLKRDYSRELVQEQVTKTPLTKSTKNGNVIGANSNAQPDGQTVHKVIGKVNDFDDLDERNKIADEFLNRYVDSDQEHMLVIDKSNNVHYLTSNSKNSIDIENVDIDFKDSYSIHTHPMSQTQYTFSTDADIPTMINCQMGVMEASDKKYRYWFKRPENITLEQWQDAQIVACDKCNEIMFEKGFSFEQYEEYREHIIIAETCKILGISENYKRWKNER
uniref:phage minor capsid protein n=1 Tax=Phocaeicola dorei TaxID=357276 RepID=UPI0040281BE6